MIQSRIRGLGRRAALAAAMASLAVGFSTAAASAEVIVTPATELPATAEVRVHGTEPPTGTAFVALVVCNAEATRGERCDLGSAVPMQPVSSYLTPPGIPMTVFRGEWLDYDFTSGFPPKELESTTTCLNEAEPPAGEECEVVASFYNQFKAPLFPPEGAPITFK